MMPAADAVADCVLAAFHQLPDKRKPRPQRDVSAEWVPLTGIVLSTDGALVCVSLGTGMKCLPHAKLPHAHGNILHDWHAEVVALRTFNRFLLDQCLLISPDYDSPFVRRRSAQECLEDHHHHPFTIKDHVQIHMYCSEAPCGDASMELVMDAQEDATPWTSAPPVISSSTAPEAPSSDLAGALRGRSNFSLLGAVRCKPSRPDAPPTLSKSCTDKLALKQATSLLSSLTSTLISPQNAYLHSLILPSSQHVPSACTRAFSRTGRLQALDDKTIQGWRGGYRWHPFAVQSTTREFAWSRRSIAPGQKAVASNLSAVWTPSWQETLIGGVLQGRKQLDPRGASNICRTSIWKTAVQLASAVGAPLLLEALSDSSYKACKDGPLLEQRKQVKHETKQHGLDGWIKNSGDEDFALSIPSSSPPKNHN